MNNNLNDRYEAACVAKVAEIFKANRERLGVSIRKLADMLGVSQTYIGALERATNGLPSEDLVIRAAAIFGMDVDVLLGASAKVATDVRCIIARNPQTLPDLVRKLEPYVDAINDAQIDRFIIMLKKPSID